MLAHFVTWVSFSFMIFLSELKIQLFISSFSLLWYAPSILNYSYDYQIWAAKILIIIRRKQSQTGKPSPWLFKDMLANAAEWHLIAGG